MILAYLSEDGEVSPPVCFIEERARSFHCIATNIRARYATLKHLCKDIRKEVATTDNRKMESIYIL